MICQTCNTELSSDFCPDCGRARLVKKINLAYFIHEFEHVLHFEKGVFFTFREMLLRPGKSVHEYLRHRREKYMKPLFFLVLTSLLYSIAVHYFERFEPSDSNLDSTKNKVFDWIEKNYGYATLIMSLFIALWMKFLFREREYNYFEILVFLCYIMGVCMVFSSILLLMEYTFKLALDSLVAMIILGYTSWAIGQLYSQKIIDYIKGVLSFILGLVSFFAASYFLAWILEKLR